MRILMVPPLTKRVEVLTDETAGVGEFAKPTALLKHQYAVISTAARVAMLEGRVQKLGDARQTGEVRDWKVAAMAMGGTITATPGVLVAAVQ